MADSPDFLFGFGHDLLRVNSSTATSAKPDMSDD